MLSRCDYFITLACTVTYQIIHNVVENNFDIVCVFLGLHPPGPPLARPVLPRERGVVDRVIEYLVGDGPQNR